MDEWPVVVDGKLLVPCKQLRNSHLKIYPQPCNDFGGWLVRWLVGRSIGPSVQDEHYETRRYSLQLLHQSVSLLPGCSSKSTCIFVRNCNLFWLSEKRALLTKHCVNFNSP